MEDDIYAPALWWLFVIVVLLGVVGFYTSPDRITKQSAREAKAMALTYVGEWDAVDNRADLCQLVIEDKKTMNRHVVPACAPTFVRGDTIGISVDEKAINKMSNFPADFLLFRLLHKE